MTPSLYEVIPPKSLKTSRHSQPGQLVTPRADSQADPIDRRDARASRCLYLADRRKISLLEGVTPLPMPFSPVSTLAICSLRQARKPSEKCLIENRLRQPTPHWRQRTLDQVSLANLTSQ